MQQNNNAILSIIQKYLILVTIVFAPSNLFLKLLPHSGYVHGLQIDFLIPKLFLTDLLMLSSFFLEVIKNWKIIKHTMLKACTQSKKMLILKFQIINKFVSQKLQNETIAGRPPIVIKRNEDSKNSQSTKQNSQFSVLPPSSIFLPFAYSLLPIAFLLHQLFTPFPLLSLWTLARLLLFMSFFFLVKNSKVISRSFILNTFLFSVLIQAVWGIGQFVSQRSLTPYWVLGETQINGQPYLARADFSWIDNFIGTNFGLSILPYGLTPHPNVLAGLLALGIVVWFIEYPPHLPRYRLAFSPQGERSFFRLTTHNLLLPTGYLLLTTLALFLTQSLSAWLAVGMFILLTVLVRHTHNNKLHFLVYSLLLTTFLILPLTFSFLPPSLPGIDTLSLTRRIELNQDAWRMFLQHPLLGVGVNQFTTFVEDISKSKEVVSFIQPAHHVGLLFLAENGLVGMALLLVFLFIIQKKVTTHNLQLAPLHSLLPFSFFLLPLLSLDHYLYTLNQGWWMVWIISMFITEPSFGKKIKKPNS